MGVGSNKSSEREDDMKKINHKILSIPPYISTSWKNINTLHMKVIEGKQVLVIVLHNGTLIEIPGLEEKLIEQIFDAHSQYVDHETKEPQAESLKTFEPTAEKENDISFSFGIPFQMSGAEGAENISSFLQHNPDQANTPKMPPDVIEKITSITKALGMDIEQMNIPKGEPHCNCPFCQMGRLPGPGGRGGGGRCSSLRLLSLRCRASVTPGGIVRLAPASIRPSDRQR